MGEPRADESDVRQGDMFVDRYTHIEREVLRVWTTRGGVVKADMYGGSGSSTIRVDRLLNPRLFVRLRRSPHSRITSRG